jgi:hypothetical protein
MFVKLFSWAVATGNPLYGAATFALQSIGNILLVSAVFTVVYRDVRVPSLFGFGWFPAMPHN